MIELSILLTIFISVGVMTLFISILIEQYHHRKYKRIQIKDDNHGGYYVKLNDHHIVDKNTIIIM